MNIKNRYFSILSMIIVSMIMFSDLKAQTPVNEKGGTKIFVQKFYDWYVPFYARYKPSKKSPAPSDIVAVNQKARYFDEQLRKALIDDADAQAKAKGELVGLDFDPFLAAQDSGFGYQAGEVKQVGNKFQIDIHGADDTKSKQEILTKKITVVAEVVKAGGSWKFTNFIYPSDGRRDNLLHILDRLYKEREKHK